MARLEDLNPGTEVYIIDTSYTTSRICKGTVVSRKGKIVQIAYEYSENYTDTIVKQFNSKMLYAVHVRDEHLDRKYYHYKDDLLERYNSARHDLVQAVLSFGGDTDDL